MALTRSIDGMEYSSEEETKPEEEVKEYWSGYTPKARKELGVVDHSTIDYPRMLSKEMAPTAAHTGSFSI